MELYIIPKCNSQKKLYTVSSHYLGGGCLTASLCSYNIKGNIPFEVAIPQLHLDGD